MKQINSLLRSQKKKKKKKESYRTYMSLNNIFFLPIFPPQKITGKRFLVWIQCVIRSVKDIVHRKLLEVSFHVHMGQNSDPRKNMGPLRLQLEPRVRLSTWSCPVFGWLMNALWVHFLITKEGFLFPYLLTQGSQHIVRHGRRFSCVNHKHFFSPQGVGRGRKSNVPRGI